MKRTAWWAVGTAVGLLTVACGTASVTAGPAKPSRGGSVVVGLPAQLAPNWFFPEQSVAAATTVNSELEVLTYMPLVYFGPHNTLSQAYGLASRVTYNKSGTRYVIDINPKWHWSNGTPVTAQDVVFTYEIMRAGSLPHTNYDWGYSGMGSGGMPTDWKSVTAVGPHTVVIETTKPVNQQWFLRNGIGQIVPVPKSVWDKYPHNMKAEMAFINSVANSPLNPIYHVVDGPWKLAGFVPNQHWTYVPNQRFDGHRAYLKQLIFQYETSSASEFEGLKQGTINYGYLPASMVKDTAQLTNDRIEPQYSLSFNYLQINMSPKAPGGIGKAFDTLPVRQALQLGVNQAGIINTIWHGYGAMDDTTLGTQPPNPMLDPALAKKPVYPFNPTKGKEILERAGWKMVNGVMTNGPLKLEFTMDCASGSNSYTLIDQLLVQNWAREGIKVNLVFQPFDTVVSYSSANANKWQAINWNGGWGYSSAYPSGGGLFASDGAENSGSYDSSEMNKLIAKTYQPADTQQTLKNMYAYEEYAPHQLPSAIFLPEQPTITVVSKSLHRALSTFNPIGGWIFPNLWWVS